MLKPGEWRERLGHTHKAMADFVGVTSVSWRNYESGRRVPPLDIIVLCETLSRGEVTVHSWLAVTLSLPQIGPGRLNAPPVRQAHEARA